MGVIVPALVNNAVKMTSFLIAKMIVAADFGEIY